MRVPFGNDFKIEIKILKRQGGEYRYLPYTVRNQPLCDFIANDTYVYPDIAKDSEFPADVANNCPLQPHNYTLNGIIFLLETVPKTIMPSGEYAVEGFFYDSEGKLFTIWRIYGEIIQI